MVHGLETMEELNAVAASSGRIKKVIVANSDDGDQAVYVDGKFVDRDSTIYAHAIVTAVGGSHVPFTLSQEEFEAAPDPWPATIEDLREQCELMAIERNQTE